MAKHSYEARAFARIPRRDDEPIFNVSVEAVSAMDALDKAAKKAEQKGVEYTYISVRRT